MTQTHNTLIQFLAISILREWLSIHSESICNNHRQTVVIYVKISLINSVSAVPHVRFLSRNLCESVVGSSVRTFTYKQSNQLSLIEVVATITIKWRMAMHSLFQGQSISKQKSHTTLQNSIDSLNERKTDSKVTTNCRTLLSKWFYIYGRVEIPNSVRNGTKICFIRNAKMHWKVATMSGK